MVTVTKDMKIGELLQLNEMVAPFLMQNGMGCIYCPSSAGESLEEACMVHGLDSAGGLLSLCSTLTDDYASPQFVP